ncbi:MAG: cystathionine gamma-lyase [Acidobacteriota bacterium]|nr:cystathionine gamma-lyase [Acidobacteriota bacterium]
MRDATRILRSTLTPPEPGTALHPGPVFAAPFHTPGDPANAAYSYARSHNPTWTHLEQAIGQMESGDGYRARALVFASGMAAVTAVFGAVLRPGDVVLLQAGAYFAARVLLQQYFAGMGVVVRTPATLSADPAQLAGVRLVWIETPSNPELGVTDIAAVSRAAHAAGALVAVDNTTATPLAQRPLALGADFSVASDTKAMTGHSDILLGHVATRDRELRQQIDQWRTLTGGVLGPMEAWLALRSMATLPLRLERSCANAQRIAEFLAAHPRVERTLYPGLPNHPGHAIARAQMRYYGPVVSFVLPSQEAAERMLQASRLITQATSFGGITTTAERRARWGGDAVAPGFVRLSAGCEDIEDLLEDLAQALDAIA